MLKTIIVLFGGFVVFILIRIFIKIKEKAKDKTVVYVCNVCGERDCLCFKENGKP
jgi:hypothetical protein